MQLLAADEDHVVGQVVDDVTGQATAAGFAAARFQGHAVQDRAFQDHVLALVVLGLAAAYFIETTNAAAAIAAPASAGTAGNRHNAIAR